MKILYEDNHLIAVRKRVGDIVQGDKTGDVPLSDMVKNFLKDKYQKPGNVYLGVVHRLDRPVSGVVLFAKTSKALPRLNKMFAEHILSHRRKQTFTATRHTHSLADTQREAEHSPSLRQRSPRQQESRTRLSPHCPVRTLLLA